MIEALGGFWFIVTIIVLLVIGDRRERRKQFERLLVDLNAYEAEMWDLQAFEAEDILDMIDQAEAWRKKLVRVRRSKDRLIKKHGLDEDKIALIHMLSNIAPGGSY